MDKKQNKDNMGMTLNEIQALIKFVARAGVTEVELEQKDFKITIKTTLNHSQAVQQPTVVMSAPVQAMAPAVAAAPAPAPAAAAQPAAKSGDDSKYITIKSPMIGTFYRSPGPDKPVFVEVGSEIKAGKVLCIIEAMKLFNEIESDISGKIVKILIDDATPVEYDQPLFLVDPS